MVAEPPPRAREEYQFTFARGVYEAVEDSVLPDDAVSLLENWIPEPTGGLRCRRGWLKTPLTGAPATSRIKSLGFYPGATRRLLAAHDNNSTGYQIQWINRDQLATGTWANVETVAASPRIRPVTFAVGAGVVLYATPEFPNARIRRWDGATAADAAPDARAGRALSYYRSRFFSGGALANPTRLWFSELGAPGTWPALFYVEVGADDGEPIEALLPTADGLLIGKESSLYLLTGAGPSTFALHEVSREAGCAPGQTLVETPGGVLVVGRSSVWLWRGAEPEKVSAPIELSYGMTGDFMSAAYIDGVCYIADPGSGTVFAFRLSPPAWWTETVDSPATNGPAALLAQGGTLLAGTRASTVTPAWYRSEPGGPRVKDADPLAETFRVRTGEMWLNGPPSPATIRHLYMQIRQRGGGLGETGLTLNMYGDEGFSTSHLIVPRAAAGVLRTREDFGRTSYGHELELEQTVPAGEASLMDVESIIGIVDLEQLR